MRCVNISYLKNNLSAIIAQLKNTGNINIIDRDQPIAVLLPYSTTSSSLDLRHLKAMQKAGIVELPSESLNQNAIQPAQLSQPIDVVRIVIEDREKGY